MRAPLAHAVTLDAAPRAPPPAPRRHRPPLRRSIRIEDPVDDGAAVDRRRQFTRSARQSSFDEGDVSDVDSPERSASCDCARASSLDRPQIPSGDSREEPDDEELEFEDEPLEEEPTRPQPELVLRVRGISSDRILHSSPAERTHHGIFERRLPKFCKLGRLEKSKRASASALYDRSPTEAFYNPTGSARLSSQELFEKFCSEDFTSLYGREDDRRRRAPHSKSTGSSGSDVRHERICCRRAPSASQSSLGAVRHQPCTSRRHDTHPRSNRSTDSEEHPSPSVYRSGTRDRPRPFDYPDFDDSDEEPTPLKKINDHSHSAPLLSPDRTDVRFTFDISERSEAPSKCDETPSDATETRNLTLYEEPHSDRTSLCELYDACFASNRPSFRRDSRRRGCGFDLTNLDFRPIDDESPRASRRPSQRSPDETIRQNSESRSWCSDSVFATPERLATTSPSSADTRRRATPRTDSAMADSTVGEEEPPSVIELCGDTSVEGTPRVKLKEVELLSEVLPDENKLNPEIKLNPNRELLPQHVLIEEQVTIVENANAGNGAMLTSRPSMHKLEPLESELPGAAPTDSELTRDHYHKAQEPPAPGAGPEPRRGRSPLFRGRKSRDPSAASGSRTRRQSRCFPL